MIRRFPSYPQGIHREVGFKVSPYDHGPPALRPSSMNPKFTRSVRNRQLAGDIDNMNAEGIETYPNELDVMAQADDVVGNGVFDPNLTHGNVHKDEGVFADKYSLPGYIDRDRFYAPSEVTDLTTGEPVEFVPGGAVAFQEGQVETLQALRELYATPPRSNWQPAQVPTQDTWIPQEFSQGVGVDPAPPAPATPAGWPTWAYAAAGFGVGLGVMFLLKGRR